MPKSTTQPVETANGIAQKLKNLVPFTVEESGWAYNGPFSTYKELHSAILGFAAGFSGEPGLKATVVAYATGRATRGSTADSHWRQVIEEPAYALGAMSLGQMAKNQGVVAALGQAVPHVL